MNKGISMQEIDDMDMLRYLDVLRVELEAAEQRAKEQEQKKHEDKTIELHRGSIDDIF